MFSAIRPSPCADAGPALARIHPADRVAGEAAMQESARTLGVWQGEYRVTLPGRGERWLSGQARPQRLRSGAVLWHGYVHDITEAKRQAMELQEKERLLRHLMEQMPIGLCIVDESGHFSFRNQRCRVLRLSGERAADAAALVAGGLPRRRLPRPRAGALERSHGSCRRT
jgi:PAS domain-containing protein